MNTKYLTVEELSKGINKNRKTILKMVKAGMPCVYIDEDTSRRPHFVFKDVWSWMLSQCDKKNARLTEIKNRMKRIEESIDYLNDHIATIQDEIEEMELALGKKEDAIDDVLDEIEDLEVEHYELEGDFFKLSLQLRNFL